MNKLILTVDYELFLGSITGEVTDCMVVPMRLLASLLALNGSKMTVFWDVLHYYKLMEYEKKYPQIRKDKLLIEEQILALAKAGHDIQLHLHSHWLDAKYNDGKWVFDYNRFKLHALLRKADKKDINTIEGCVYISKGIIENLIQRIIPDYRVTTFRAGGYLIQPFSILKESLTSNNIFIDSSVCPGLKNENSIFSYDYTSIHERRPYRFNNDPGIPEIGGSFIEIPIGSIIIPAYLNLFFVLLKKLKYPRIDNNRKGLGSGDSTNKLPQSIIRKIFKIMLHSKTCMFTTDGTINEKFIYMLKRTNENSTMIMHPKLLNVHSLFLLGKIIKKNRIEFCSISQYISWDEPK